MKTPRCSYQSPLAEAIQDFIAHKRALGCKYATEEKALCLFDHYLFEQGVRDTNEITTSRVEAFLCSRPRRQPRSYHHLIGVLQRLFDWLVLQGRLSQSPLSDHPRRPAFQRRPFIFNNTQARRLLELAASLPDNSNAPRRGETYSMIFALLYGLGLRVGEVSRLCRQDVDLERQCLRIRETKFSKTRLIPFGPRMSQRIEHYLLGCERYRVGFTLESPLFSFHADTPIHPGTISQTFHQLLPRVGLKVPEGSMLPSAHCLRHSFAVNTLLRWYRTNQDPGSRLLHLSTFLGHVNPTSTAIYLTITADLLREAGRRFEQFATPLTKEEYQWLPND